MAATARDVSTLAELKDRFGDLVSTILNAYRVQRENALQASQNNGIKPPTAV